MRCSSSLIFCSSPLSAFCNFSPRLRLLRPLLPVYFQFFYFPIRARSGFCHWPTAISGSFRHISTLSLGFPKFNSMSVICVRYIFKFLYSFRHNFRYSRYTPVSPQVTAKRVLYILSNAFTCFSCTLVLKTSGAPGTPGTHRPLSA